MIVLKHKQIQGYDFVNAFRKLANCTKLNYKNFYGVKKLTEKFEKEGKISQDVRKSIVEKYADKNDDGTTKEIIDANGKKTGQADVPADKQEALQKEMADFMESDVEFPYNKLDFSEAEVHNAQLSPLDVVVLDAILELQEPKEASMPTGLHAVPNEQVAASTAV